MINKWLMCESSDHGITLSPIGHWKTSNLEHLPTKLSQKLSQNQPPAVVVDGAQLESLDTGGCLCLKKILAQLTPKAVSFQNLSEESKRLLELVLSAPTGTATTSRLNIIETISNLGLRVEALLVPLFQLIGFLGKILCDIVLIPVRISRFRFNEFVIQLDRALLQALPVISMVTFLVGVVVAYLFATQIEKYGANIFIVDSVVLAMARELSPLIVATVVAGRSGSAFTAQIGSMILTQEVDAIETMGLRAIDVLVIPRVLALVLALPVLVFVGDLVSIYGGSVIAHSVLDVTPATFMERLQKIRSQHFISGLIKAPFFALAIGIIGCKMGLSVESNARSVGLNTTSTVVQSIVAVILLDSAFAVIFMQLQY